MPAFTDFLAVDFFGLAAAFFTGEAVVFFEEEDEDDGCAISSLALTTNIAINSFSVGNLLCSTVNSVKTETFFKRCMHKN